MQSRTVSCGEGEVEGDGESESRCWREMSSCGRGVVELKESEIAGRKERIKRESRLLGKW